MIERIVRATMTYQDPTSDYERERVPGNQKFHKDIDPRSLEDFLLDIHRGSEHDIRSLNQYIADNPQFPAPDKINRDIVKAQAQQEIVLRIAKRFDLHNNVNERMRDLEGWW